jgi:hypothetical protein
VSRKLYTVADHQKAFEIWYETKNLTRTAEVIGCEYTTIRDWQLDTYKCRYNCPWHGWDRLDKERRAALDARFKLLEDGNLDPLAHQQAMTEAVEKAPDLDSNLRRQLAVDTIVRSDLERISHFELLYGKIFHQATGVAIDHGGIQGLPSGADRYQAMQTLYNFASVKTTSMESAVKSLIALSEHIKKLQEDLGVKKRTGFVPPTTVEQVPEDKPAPELTIEELRKFRELLEHTPADKVDILKKIMRADDALVRQVLEEPQPVLVADIPPPPPAELLPASQ